MMPPNSGRKEGLEDMGWRLSKLHDVASQKGINLCNFAITPSIYVISLALYPCLEPYRSDDEGQGEIIPVQAVKACGGIDTCLSHYLARQ